MTRDADRDELPDHDSFVGFLVDAARRPGNTMEAVRCIERPLSDLVYRRMLADTQAAKTGPG